MLEQFKMRLAELRRGGARFSLGSEMRAREGCRECGVPGPELCDRCLALMEERQKQQAAELAELRKQQSPVALQRTRQHARKWKNVGSAWWKLNEK